VNPQALNSLLRGVRHGRLEQQPDEYAAFFEFTASYFENRVIKPLVVEIGLWRQVQRVFYEQLMGAQYIGIDITNQRTQPDILGDSDSAGTNEEFRKRIDGKPINLLFIDGDHSYKGVKQDWEMYGPMATHLIAFHDIAWSPGVVQFWDELRKESKYTMVEFHHNLTGEGAEFSHVFGIAVVIK
jgi:hypothetical protein